MCDKFFFLLGGRRFWSSGSLFGNAVGEESVRATDVLCCVVLCVLVCLCGLGPLLQYRICFYELMEKALCLCVCVSYVYSERT